MRLLILFIEMEKNKDLSICPICEGAGYINSDSTKKEAYYAYLIGEYVEDCKFCKGTGFLPKGHPMSKKTKDEK